MAKGLCDLRLGSWAAASRHGGEFSLPPEAVPLGSEKSPGAPVWVREIASFKEGIEVRGRKRKRGGRI